MQSSGEIALRTGTAATGQAGAAFFARAAARTPPWAKRPNGGVLVVGIGGTFPAVQLLNKKPGPLRQDLAVKRIYGSWLVQRWCHSMRVSIPSTVLGAIAICVSKAAASSDNSGLCL